MNVPDELLYKTMRAKIYKTEEHMSSNQILGRQLEQEQERIKVLKNIKKKSTTMKQKAKQFIHRPMLNDEKEFLEKINGVDTSKERVKERLSVFHNKYTKQWKHPRIMRLTRTKAFCPY